MASPLFQAVVKLGGSVVTDKGSEDLRVRRDTVRRLARELSEARLDRLIVVHGAGSFGHRIVKRSGIDRGCHVPGALMAWAQTQRLQYQLAAEITAILIDAGLPAIAVQASASALLDDGVLVHMDSEVCRRIVDAGGVPVLYGVPAVDRARGCAILSGDQIAPYLATALGIDMVIHATDVDGVYDGDPHGKGAQRHPHIHHGNLERVLHGVGGSRHVDVTGGMVAKLQGLMAVAHKGVRGRIIDANIAGQLAAALAGQAVGSLITWEKT